MADAMMPVLINDVLAAAERLLPLPPRHRERACRCLIDRARRADAWRVAQGRVHPRFGNGTLEAAAMAGQTRRGARRGVDFLGCVATVLACLSLD
ncbi:MAG: hypothetical protein R3D60_01520 [Paracoccaceae bacterium]